MLRSLNFAVGIFLAGLSGVLAGFRYTHLSRGLPSINMAVEPLAIVRGQFRARTELRLLR